MPASGFCARSRRNATRSRWSARALPASRPRRRTLSSMRCFQARVRWCFRIDEWEDNIARVATPNRRIQLAVHELFQELDSLATEATEIASSEFPFVLSAGERRSFTANTIIRNPAWRKKDRSGALRMNPDDAKRVGVTDGGRVRLSTKRASAEVSVGRSRIACSPATFRCRMGWVSIFRTRTACSRRPGWRRTSSRAARIAIGSLGLRGTNTRRPGWTRFERHDAHAEPWHGSTPEPSMAPVLEDRLPRTLRGGAQAGRTRRRR